MKTILPNNTSRLNSTLLIGATLISLLITQITLTAELPLKNEKRKVKQVRTIIPNAFPDLAITYIGKENSIIRYGSCSSRIKISVKNDGHSGKSSMKYILTSGKPAQGSEQRLLLKVSKKFTLPSETDLIDQQWSFRSDKTRNFIVKHKFPAAGKYSLTSNISICLKNETRCEKIPELNTKNNSKKVVIVVTEPCR